ncbi:ImmA/IrrE family metallo-endopeptidase [Companilactobacillus mishanensis]|nr:ImmA/IrrE family metallo-endopeptidase [Companilactobacillus mishanensis]
MNDQVFINANRSYEQNLQDVAEEIGHFKTTVGNIVEQKSELDKKQELEARRFGHMTIVNLDGLIECYKVGILTSWDLSDFFEVRPKYIWQALETYKSKYGEVFIHNGYVFDLRNGLNIHPATKREVQDEDFLF